MRILFALCLLAGAAQADTIYKCSSDGKVTYSQTPCATGATSSVLDVPAAPARDSAAAAELQRQKSEADALQKARQKREAKEDREAAKSAAVAAAHRKKCAKLALEKKWADDEARGVTSAGATGYAMDSSASGGTVSTASAARARQKASHAADLLALECPK
jgi:hypothetical protein